VDFSPWERMALDYCAPHGVPLSVFLGRTVYPGEPLWLVRDAEAAMWWQAEQSWRCTECGLDTRQTVGPAHEDKWNAELSGHCDGCRAAERARADLNGNDHPAQHAGARLRFWRDEEVTGGDVAVRG
jgi:hypothetical protein